MAVGRLLDDAINQMINSYAVVGAARPVQFGRRLRGGKHEVYNWKTRRRRGRSCTDETRR